MGFFLEAGTEWFGFSDTEDIWSDVVMKHLFIVSSRIPGCPDHVVEVTYRGSSGAIDIPVALEASGWSSSHRRAMGTAGTSSRP